METDRDLLDAYPSKPPKLIMKWNDARVQLARAGETFVAAGRVSGSAEDLALMAAESEEQELHLRLFGM